MNTQNDTLGVEQRIRDELSYCISTQEGKVFFDLKSNAQSEYLKITQSTHLSSDTYKRSDIFIDKSELRLFRKAIDKAIEYLEFKEKSKKDKSSSKAYTLEDKRKEHAFAYKKWDDEADALLARLFDEGHSISELAEMFERSEWAIESRLSKIGKR